MKNIRKFLSLVLLIILLSANFVTTSAYWWEGDGTQKNPYKIRAIFDLAQLAIEVNNGNSYDNIYFSLEADIEASYWNKTPGGDDYTDGKGWIPIGTDENPFNGKFNGNEFVIKNLEIKSSSAFRKPAGLFGCIGGNGEVQSLGVSGGRINGRTIGGIAAENRGTIENCFNTSILNMNSADSKESGIGTENGGGIAGLNSGKINNCFNSGEINISSGSDSATYKNTGGITGFNSGEITNCYNSGAIYNRTPDTGVRSGYPCFTYAGISAINSGLISNCYNAGRIITFRERHSFYSEISLRNNPGAVVTNCYYIEENKNVTDDMLLEMTKLKINMEESGFSDMLNFEAFSDTYSEDVQLNCGHDIKYYPQLRVFANSDKLKEISLKSAAHNDVHLNEEAFSEGNGTKDNPYLIYTAKQLNHIREHTGENIYFKLMTDIDILNFVENDKDPNAYVYYSFVSLDGHYNVGWKPVGTEEKPFNGVFDGNGFSINNLTMSRRNDTYSGLFGYIALNGEVKNLTLTGINIIGGTGVGAVCGYNEGTIFNCNIFGKIEGTADFDGFAGINKGSITDCVGTYRTAVSILGGASGYISNEIVKRVFISDTAPIKKDAYSIKYVYPRTKKLFQPDEIITRYEVLEYLYNLLKLDRKKKAWPFSDIDEKHTDMAYEFKANNIIGGYGDNTFRGETGISRAEFVEIMAKILQVSNLKDSLLDNNRFTDIENHWAKNNIIIFSNLRFVNGYEDNIFAPENQITRAEFVVMVNRIIGVQLSGSSGVFDDLNYTHWAFRDIMSSVNIS